MPAPENRYRLLDVDLHLDAPGAVADMFDHVYGRFAPPCACSWCEGLDVREAGITVAPATGGRHAVSSTWEQAEVPEEQIFAYLLYLVQNHAVRSSRHFYTVHGACLEIGGRGCILSAASCVGKTTLTYELVRRGAAFLSDEIAAVPVRGPGLHAFPRALGLRPGSIEVLDLAETVRNGFTSGHGELKHFLDMPGLFPDRSRSSNGLHTVILLAPPAEEADAASAELASLEITLPDVPDGFTASLNRIEGVKHVRRLDDRPTETLRILHPNDKLIVQAVDRAARRCGAYIAGHHRGRSRPIDYTASPTCRPLTVREGIQRLAANTLNLRRALAPGSAAAVFGRFAGCFNGVRFAEVTPGELVETAEMVTELVDESEQ